MFLVRTLIFFWGGGPVLCCIFNADLSKVILKSLHTPASVASCGDEKKIRLW